MLVQYREIFAQKNTRGLLAASLLMMSAIGVVYIWSVFILPLEEEFGWPRNKISLVFSATMVGLTSGIAFGGFIHRRLPTKKLITFLTALVATALTISSVSYSLNMLILFYGAICGLSMGIMYNLALYKCNSCFSKDAAAAVSGLLQTCVAGSTVVWGYLAANLLDFYDWRIVLRIVGSLIIISLLISRNFLSREYSPATATDCRQTPLGTENITSRQMLATKNFWFFALIRLPILSCGIGLIGHAIPVAIELGVPQASGIWALGLISLCNGLGRALFGIIWGWAGVRKTILLAVSMFLSALALLLLSPLHNNSYLVLLAFALCGLGYGGAILMGTAFTRTIFGAKYFAENFGITSLSMVVSSFIGPLVYGEGKLLTGTYADSLSLFAVCSLLSLLLLPALKKSTD